MELQVSPDQRRVLKQLLQWWSRKNQQWFSIGGLAGTGKTTVAAAFLWLLHQKKPDLRVALAAYTGKAARVLASTAGRWSALGSKDRVSTIHSLIYRRGEQNPPIWERRTELPLDLLILDEGSMIPSDIWRDLLSFNIPIAVFGDHGQLSPIGDTAQLMEKPTALLNAIHRQAQDSPIIQLAHTWRLKGKLLQIQDNRIKIFPSDNAEARVQLDDLLMSWQPDTLFVTGYNKTRMGLNQAIRASQYRSTAFPEAGDRVLCLQNDWRLGLVNGMLGTLTQIDQLEESENDWRRLRGTVVPDDGDWQYEGWIARRGFNEAAPARLTAVERIEQGGLFDYGYALTVHKAQGSQARKVVVIAERTKHQSDDEWRRWLYTAITRAQEELILFVPSTMMETN